MEAFFIIGIISIIAGVVCAYKNYSLYAFSLAFLGGYFISPYLWETSESNSLRGPQAIDVYRGKTTLEITYRDSIPVDSVVVFKEKEK